MMVLTIHARYEFGKQSGREELREVVRSCFTRTIYTFSSMTSRMGSSRHRTTPKTIPSCNRFPPFRYRHNARDGRDIDDATRVCI